jgi:hypothetical protein
MEREDLIVFLKWLKASCTPRTTSRNNVYASYWQVKDTGLLYTDEELIAHWEKHIKR